MMCDMMCDMPSYKVKSVSECDGSSNNKLDGVGPVDNRPSTDKLHHFVQKKEEEKREKNDM